MKTSAEICFWYMGCLYQTSIFCLKIGLILGQKMDVTILALLVLGKLSPLWSYIPS